MNIMPPRYTQVPNELLDNLKHFSNPEIAILMALCRLTFGYHRAEVVASNSTIAELSGLAVSTVIRNAKALESRGIIRHEYDGYGKSIWSIIIEQEEEQPKKEKPKTAKESVYDKAVALAAVCKMDFQTNKGMLLGNAKRIPLTVSELNELFGPNGVWYIHDFRGKKGSPPSLKQVSTEFKKLQGMISVPEETKNNSVVIDGAIYA